MAVLGGWQSGRVGVPPAPEPNEPAQRLIDSWLSSARPFGWAAAIPPETLSARVHSDAMANFTELGDSFSPNVYQLAEWGDITARADGRQVR